jgi:hypothetical protein
MESIRRGPRCAKRLIGRLAQIHTTRAYVTFPVPTVRVLRGGADGWLRRHWRDSLVEGFDDAYWGWEDGLRAADPATLGAAVVHAAPQSSLQMKPKAMHRLYARPVDQVPDV